MTTIRLREHQVRQKARIRAWAGYPVRSPVPPGGARATGVSATGSGKTYTAAAAALEYFPRGRILVTVPTLDLLVQTARAWRRIGHRAPMVGVCSLENDEVLDRLGVRTTTNPVRLALWAGRGPVVVLATYASLVERTGPGGLREPGPLEAALAGGPRMYGQRLERFDLAVVDEAHGTTGDAGRPWAAIHDDVRIPVDFRLYLTATPRVLAAPRPGREEGRTPEIVSMRDDPDGPYGRWIFELGLAEAVERGILASFEIDVLEIHDPRPGQAVSGEARRGRRLGLLQTALLEHAAAHGLRTVMTFHQRVEEAEAFAARLPVTAAALYGARGPAGLAGPPASPTGAEPYDLVPGRHVRPDRVWSAWLCGEHLVAERRETVRRFADGTDAAGRRVDLAFLASVRVLGEGVDITGERGVEAVCFADPRGSQVEITQNIGRALRPAAGGAAKTARILVPVFLSPGEDPSGMLSSASYEPLVNVLQALRSHSERLVEQLASRALTRGARRSRLRRDAAGRIVPAGEAAESELLRFASPRDPATVAAFLRTRVHRPESLVWLEGYQALRRWREENGVRGPCAVPYDAETDAGVSRYPVGRWTHQQRKASRAGELEPHRRELLDEAGMVWEPGEEAWQAKLAALRAFRRAHGHLAPRQDAVWADDAGGLVPVGRHLANLRRRAGLGKDPERAARRAGQLAAVDPDWNCPWPLDWQRQYRVLADLVDADGPGVLAHLRPGVLFEGDDLGRWYERQRLHWAELTGAQRDRLTAAGVTPAGPARAPAPAVPVAAPRAASPRGAFERGAAALARFTAREGHPRVPRGHVERIETGDGGVADVRLGVWMSNTRSRREGLTGRQRATLSGLGVPWA